MMESEKIKPHRNATQLLGKFLCKLKKAERRLGSNKTSRTTVLSESTTSGSFKYDEHINDESITPNDEQASGSEENPKIDLRYGGQCLTPEQLPEFCDQLHRLIDVIRNVQYYAKVVGEYPRDLERRLEEEAREVVALTAEVQNARDVIARTRIQRRAVKMQRKALANDLLHISDIETRELENTVRMSDRKLYRTWENLKDSTDAAMFEPLLEEIQNKQSALDCLLRLVQNKQASLNKLFESNSTSLQGNESALTRRRHDQVRRASLKRRRKEMREARSVPLSNESSLHIHSEPMDTTRRFSSNGTVSLPPIRDIVLFTTS